jgi:hypothetical protein
LLSYLIALPLSAKKNDKLLNLEARVNVMDEELKTAIALGEQVKPNAMNPSIAVIGDLLAQYGHDVPASKGHEFQNGLLVREVAFEFRGSVDPIADALVAMAIGQHGRSFHLHLEEAFLNFTPWAVAVKVGRFKAAFGRLNRLHMHNLPQITYPLAIQSFFGEEGFASQGFSLSMSHVLSDTAAITVTAEGLMGERLPWQERAAAKMPGGLLNVWWHQEAAADHLLDMGLSSYLGWRGEVGDGLFGVYGGDFRYSYVPAGYGADPIFLLGAEAFLAQQAKEDRWASGGFLWAQSKMIDSSFLGLRYDLAQVKPGDSVFQHALGLYVGYYHTEFLRFRLGYEHVMPNLGSLAGDHRLLASINFVLGSHPEELYGVNR